MLLRHFRHKSFLHMYLYLIELSKTCKNNGKVEVSSEIEGSVSVIGKQNSEAENSVKRKFIDQKEKQIQDAVRCVHGSYLGQMGIEEDNH